MILNGSAHVFLNLSKNNKQFVKIYPGTQKKIGNVKCNKTITALHFVQYYTITALERDQYEILLLYSAP